MSATFAIISGFVITVVVCATTCALFLPSAQTHRVWAARWAQARAAWAQSRANRAQSRAQVRTARARAARREVNKG